MISGTHLRLWIKTLLSYLKTLPLTSGSGKSSSLEMQATSDRPSSRPLTTYVRRHLYWGRSSKITHLLIMLTAVTILSYSSTTPARVIKWVPRESCCSGGSNCRDLPMAGLKRSNKLGTSDEEAQQTTKRKRTTVLNADNLVIVQETVLKQKGRRTPSTSLKKLLMPFH